MQTRGGFRLDAGTGVLGRRCFRSSSILGVFGSQYPSEPGRFGGFGSRYPLYTGDVQRCRRSTPWVSESTQSILVVDVLTTLEHSALPVVDLPRTWGTWYLPNGALPRLPVENGYEG